MKLEERQAQMRSKNERQKLKPKPPRSPRAVTPQRAIKIFLAQELRKAYVIRRKKRQAHLRYLELKRSKKKVTKALLAETREMLRTFRELNLAMAESRDALRGALRTFDRQSKQFQMGYELAKEHRQIKMQGDS